MGIRSAISETFGRLGNLVSALDPGVSEVAVKTKGTPGKYLEPPKPSEVVRKGFEYGIQIGGTGANPSQADAYSQERLQILTQLYQAYLTCPWVSGPIDLISRTATAGGLTVVVEDIADHDGKIPDDPPEVQRLRRLLKFTNPREDMVQLLRSCATDLLLFGDAYIEIVTLLDEPVALYTLDATTMTVLCDEHGEVMGYKQNVDGIRTAEFGPEDVIHISLDAPRGGMYGVSPAQKALLPVTAWLFTEATIKENFRRGDPPRLHVDLGTLKDGDVQKWREQYMVNNLGPKAVGTPIITTGGGQVGVLDPRKVADYLNTSKQLRDEIISCFGTPPSKLGIIETGNIGAGTGEAQDKTFRINTIYPIQALILEKMNYHLLQVGFHIHGWHLEFGEIDMRDSKVVEEIRDTRLRNGSYTLNRYRDEIGEPPVDGGDQAVLIDRQNIVLWSNMDALSQAGIAYKLKGTGLAPGEPQEGEPLGIQKPEPADIMAQPPQPPQPQQAAKAPELEPAVPDNKPARLNKRISPDARPGGPKDATQGKSPRESRFEADERRLKESWRHAYSARRRMALEQLPPLTEVPDVEPKEAPLPTDPYWEADAHNHNDRPDYTAADLGLTQLNRIQVDPRDVQVDHSYQRPTQQRLVDRYSQEPRQKLAERAGLLAIRSDGSMWVVDGQHHTLAAAREHINSLTYQSFLSTGPEMEAEVYARYQAWHRDHQHHEQDLAHAGAGESRAWSTPKPGAKPRRKR